jgi:O-antigen/teichoic acid export membrane protein
MVLIFAQIASTAITARLVAPEEFGVYATAQIAATFTGYFTMVALGPGLQRRATLSRKTVGTALTLSLAGALFVPVLLWFGANAWADVWNIPDATGIVKVMAVALALTSAATVPIALIRRNLDFAKAATIETAAVVIGLVVGVGLAAALHSAFALALGYAVGSAALAISATLLARHDLSLGFDRAEARELFVFANQVGGLGFYTNLTMALPAWFTARSFGAATLGVYSRANLIVALPAFYAASSIFKVIFPLYGHVRENIARTRTLLDEALTLTTGIVWPSFALVAGASPVLIEVLLGSRWAEGAPLVPMFVLAACAYVAGWLLSNAAEAFGWMRLIAFRQTACVAVVIATLVVAELADLSLTLMLAGVAAAQWLGYALTLIPVARRDMLELGPALRRQAVHAGAALACFAAAALCAEALENAPIGIQALGQLVVGAVAAIVFIQGRAWMPATQVLARRMGVPPGESLVRGALSYMR